MQGGFLFQRSSLALFRNRFWDFSLRHWAYKVGPGFLITTTFHQRLTGAEPRPGQLEPWPGAQRFAWSVTYRYFCAGPGCRSPFLPHDVELADRTETMRKSRTTSTGSNPFPLSQRPEHVRRHATPLPQARRTARTRPSHCALCSCSCYLVRLSFVY
jgi:hypothetical protein